jgi:hypothetical protein
MLLVLQIAAGILVAVAALGAYRRWRRQRRRLAEAFDFGSQIADSMNQAISERLQWSIGDLRTRFLDVLDQRLTILEEQVRSGSADATAVAQAETLNYASECDALHAVIRAELEAVAEPWVSGPIRALDEKAAEGGRARVMAHVTAATVIDEVDPTILALIDDLKAEGVRRIASRLHASPTAREL